MFQKLLRFLTSLLPVASNRVGSCNGCGDCCKLPYVCPFLKQDKDDNYTCSVYFFRPPSCRKYPRIEAEQLTPENCGFSFVNADNPADIIATSTTPHTNYVNAAEAEVEQQKDAA
ncbi:Uncharacterised protein [BD1-7 clade bacterium]|nr:Uncharacterised protein [BD1-7 clade bacterium]